MDHLTKLLPGSLRKVWLWSVLICHPSVTFFDLYGKCLHYQMFHPYQRAMLSKPVFPPLSFKWFCDFHSDFCACILVASKLWIVISYDLVWWMSWEPLHGWLARILKVGRSNWNLCKKYGSAPVISFTPLASFFFFFSADPPCWVEWLCAVWSWSFCKNKEMEMSQSGTTSVNPQPFEFLPRGVAKPKWRCHQNLPLSFFDLFDK